MEINYIENVGTVTYVGVRSSTTITEGDHYAAARLACEAMGERDYFDNRRVSDNEVEFKFDRY